MIHKEFEATVLIRTPPSRINTISVGTAVLVLIPIILLKGSGLLLVVAAIIFWSLVAYLETLRQARFVDIDIGQNSIVVCDRSWTFRKRKTAYELRQFRFVISYIVPGRRPENRIELLTQTSGEALWLVSFSVRASDNFFFRFVPKLRWHEVPQATLMRARLMTDLQLEDKGFVGTRWPGTQVRHET